MASSSGLSALAAATGLAVGFGLGAWYATRAARQKDGGLRDSVFIIGVLSNKEDILKLGLNQQKMLFQAAIIYVCIYIYIYVGIQAWKGRCGHYFKSPII